VARLNEAVLSWPGRLETPGLVKRRLLVVATAAALALTGFFTLNGRSAPAPFTNQQLVDLSGLPRPPVRFVPGETGGLRQLTPEEFRQLERIRQLIEHFPVPEVFIDRFGVPGKGKGKNDERGG
jgi:hypothetical protein